jgi:hypothetical protein
MQHKACTEVYEIWKYASLQKPINRLLVSYARATYDSLAEGVIKSNQMIK